MQPQTVNNIELVFPANVRHLMPPEEEIPEDYWRFSGPKQTIAARWFYQGLDTSILIAKKGIDKQAAIRHLSAVLGSWEHKHEYKMAAASYLIDQWFDVKP